MSEHAKYRLQKGDEYPYDASDDWWAGNGENPPAPIDWAHRAARGVVADLSDRRAIKQGFDNIDEEVRAEIIATLAEIIRLASPIPRSP